MVRFLLDQGADPNKEMGMLTPFTLCLSENPVDLNLLREFFHKSDSRKPVSLEAKGYGGWSAMHWLAGNGSDRSALDLLVKNGGDVNILNDKNRSPLHLILDRREIPLDLLRGFIEHKANVTAEDNDSESESFLSHCTRPILPGMTSNEFSAAIQGRKGRRGRCNQTAY
jgi:hypothetical protein